jgi:hypothetical protein
MGWRLAALGGMTALMVALPLHQAMRYQDNESRALEERRARLDPMNRAIDVQRSLLVHRDVAAAVLGGQARREPERQMRQGEVDQRLGALDGSLLPGPWPRAQMETGRLRDDWSALARGVQARRLSGAESDQGHRLLVEQVLLVIDLLADAVAPQGAADAARESWQQARALPRLAARQAAEPGAAGTAWTETLARAHAALQAVDAASARQQEALKWSKRLLLAVMAGLALAVVLIARSLWVDGARRAVKAVAAGDEAPPRNPDRQAAESLIGRLRGAEDAPHAPDPPLRRDAKGLPPRR